MPSFPMVLLTGLAGGLVASAVMEAFQNAAAKPFGLDGGTGEPATVKAAGRASIALTDRPIPKRYRPLSGRAVHYATGGALGIGYAALAARYPVATLGFGSAFGVATALALDEAAVPAFGLGSPPSETPAKTHGYSLASHIVFGTALEGVRRGGLALLAR